MSNITPKPIKSGMRAIHPGEILQEEFLLELFISPYDFAHLCGVEEQRIVDFVHCKSGVDEELAKVLSKTLNTTVEFWMNLQAAYDKATDK